MSNITIYTKDYCPFCIKAKSLLTMKKIKFTEINLNENPDQFDEMLKNPMGLELFLKFLMPTITLETVIKFMN